MNLDNHFHNLAFDHGDALEEAMTNYEREENERDEVIDDVISKLRVGEDALTFCGTEIFYIELFDDVVGCIEPEDRPRICYGLSVGDEKAIKEFNALLEIELKRIKEDWR